MGVRSVRGRQRLTFDDFSGGVNFSDNPMLVEANELSAAVNMTLSGNGLVQRYGMRSHGYINGATRNPLYVFYAPDLNSAKIVVLEGAALVSYDLTPLSGRTVIKTFSGIAPVQCVSFAGLLVVAHQLDGVWYGTTSNIPTALTQATTQAAGALAVWQNKVWATDTATSGIGNRVFWSNPGDPTTFTIATDYVDIRDVDDTQTRAFGNGNGMDVIGRGGLLVAKLASLYRIYDSTTGAYTTIDSTRGAGSSQAFTSGPDGLYMANTDHIYRIRGDDVREITDYRIRKLWSRYQSGGGGTGTLAWSANGRHYFAGGTGSGVGNIILEWIPGQDCWFVYRFTTNAGTAIPVLSASSFGYSPQSGGEANGAYVLAGTVGGAMNILQMPADVENADATFVTPEIRDEWDPSTGVAQFSWAPSFATSWIGGGLDDVRLDRLVVQGWCGDNTSDGTVGLTVYKDFDQSTLWRTLTSLTFPAASGTISPAMADRAVVNHVGAAKAFQFRFTPTATSATERTPDAPYSLATTILSPAFGITAIQADLTGLRN